jgi:hypothetical protein
MSGTVGAGGLRRDVWQDTVDRTARTSAPELVEDGQRIRAQNVVQPFDRARTIDVVTLEGFYTLFSKILTAATQKDGTHYPIRFTKEFPPDEVELPCFGVKLLKRSPFRINGRDEIAARHMEERSDPDYPGEMMNEYLRRQENLVEVTTWAKTNKVAGTLANWLEDKYWEYIWALQWGGLAHPVRWDGRGADIYRQVKEQQIYGAPATFYVVTAKIIRQRVTAIRKISTSIGILLGTGSLEI